MKSIVQEMAIYRAEWKQCLRRRRINCQLSLFLRRDIRNIFPCNLNIPMFRMERKNKEGERYIRREIVIFSQY
jgi:hypothetical protein